MEKMGINNEMLKREQGNHGKAMGRKETEQSHKYSWG